MIYRGLENNYYLVNNPIYLKFDGTTTTPIENKLVSVSIGDANNFYPFEVQMHNGLAIIDLSPIIKHLMGAPNFFDKNNIAKISAGAIYDGNTYVIFNNKLFVRGSRYTGTNNNLTNGEVLKVTDKIPSWSGYPTRKYFLEGDQISEAVPSSEEIEVMGARSCKGAYVRFLNHKGGYSDYLFENFSIRKAGDQGEVIKNYIQDNSFEGGIDYHNNFTQLSANGEYEISVEGRIDQRYYNLMFDLVHSSEVLIYEFDKLIGSDFGYPAQPWTKLINPGNSISIDSEDETSDVAFTFNTMFTKNNKVNA